MRGPATLLYGSNAVGGVVNAVTPHQSQRDSPISGTHGHVGADTGSANAQAGTNASVLHTTGRLLVWAGGGSRRSSDYKTPEGTVKNSATRLSNGRVGVGYTGDRLFASGGVQVEDSRHGIPFAGEFEGRGAEEPGTPEEDVFIELASRRHVGRFDAGMRNLPTGIIDEFRVVFNVIDLPAHGAGDGRRRREPRNGLRQSGLCPARRSEPAPDRDARRQVRRLE